MSKQQQENVNVNDLLQAAQNTNKVTEEELKEIKKEIRGKMSNVVKIFKNKEIAKKYEFVIERISFLIIHCKKLEDFLNKNGFSEMYLHGKGQFGMKESVESQVYFKTIKSLNTLIKQLRDILKENDEDVSTDDLDNLLQ